MSKSKKIICNNPDGYPEQRNIIRENDDAFFKIKDIFHYGLNLYFLITKKSYHPFFKGLFYYPFFRENRAIFFNTINLGRQPWEVYFETSLPRLGKVPKWLEKYCIKQLAKARCENIYAISQCAYDIQLTKLKKEHPDFYEIIKSKMRIKYPPQKPLINSYEEKELPTNKIVFTLVGSDFFRKGGREILEVFNELIPLYPQLYLNIVSALNYGDYASKATEIDLNRAKYIINKFELNICHYTKLPNIEVLELFKKSHIGLLPTWGDTFGYSVLEAQASGCPVISTNLRALPEVNNDDIGWMVHIPLTKNKDALIRTKEERFQFSKTLKNKLREHLINLLNNPFLIRLKGEKVLEQIKLKYETYIS